MTRLALTLVLVAACGDSGDSNLPVNPGGGGGGNIHLPDAAVDLDASTMLSARVCLVADPRQPTACASAGADGFTVMVGTQQATTAADGSFTIMKPTGSSLVWRVSGTGIVSSAMPYSATTTKIPVIATTTYSDMLAAMNVTVVTGDGAVMLQFQHTGTPVSGVVASATPTPDSAIYYDGAGINAWNLDATGPYGTVWIPSLVPGTVSVGYDDGTNQGTVSGLPVFGDTITFAWSELP